MAYIASDKGDLKVNIVSDFSMKTVVVGTH